MRNFLFLLFVVSVTGVQAQFTYQVDQSIPVKKPGDITLPLAWSGGINASQVNTIDLNGDGQDDLLLFDRMANKPIPFVRKTDHYEYDPAYESFFPSDLLNWVLLRDFNCDGKKDIFTGDIFGIKVFLNATPPGGLLAWEPFLFYEEGRDHKSIPLLTKAFSDKVNLQMMYDDLPAIADADGDGDLDIFNFRFSGSGTIEFHRNYSKERYGTCDSLDFERETQKWAGFTECDCGDFAFNNAACPSSGRIKHAAGKSLTLMDANADGKLDLLISEATCTQLYALLNNGDVYTPDLTTSQEYPFAIPVNMVIFPAAFYEDLDFDGVKDFIATPNIYKNDYFTSNLKETMWYYKNTGTDDAPNLTFVKTNFLQDDMIDVGDNAVPAFADYDGDGDLDMFISQYTSEEITAGIYLYENTGTPNAPSFQLVTNDFLNLRARQYFNLKIQFAHVNGDGQIDIVFTANNFEDGDNNLYFAMDQTAEKGFQLGSISKVSFELLGPENVNMTDVNQDGMSDLLVGRTTGNLEYWRNTGSGFVLEDNTYLGFEFSILKQALATDAGDLDADGNIDLVFGDAYGEVSIVSNYREAQRTNITSPISSIVYNPLTDGYDHRNLGGRVWPTIANLYGTNRPVIVVGNVLGGVHMLTNTNPEGGAEEPSITIHPVPTTSADGLKVFSSQNGTARIIAATGQEIRNSLVIAANETTVIPLYSISSGVYILQLTIGNKTYIKRFVISG